MEFFLESVSANTTLAYFNGVRLPKSEVFTWNPFKKPTVYLVETSGNPGQEAEFLDILPECADWNVYRASTGHKINHSGKNYNQAYTECFHPIFGKILCSYSLKVSTQLCRCSKKNHLCEKISSNSTKQLIWT